MTLAIKNPPGPADALAVAGKINVQGYGVKGDNVTIDTAAIQAVIDRFGDGQHYYFGPGNYVIDGTIYARGTVGGVPNAARRSITIELARGATIKAATGADWNAGNTDRNPMLDLSGCQFASLLGPGTIDSRGNAVDAVNRLRNPAAAVAIGRVAISPTSDAGGGEVDIRKVTMTGCYSVATLYNATGEQVTVDSCQLQTEDPATPVYLDTATDGVRLTTNEQQVIDTKGATGGTFTLTIYGKYVDSTTAAIARNASQAAVKSAIETALAGANQYGPSTVTVTGAATLDAGTMTVEFSGGSFAGRDVPRMGLTSSLTGGSATATVTRTGYAAVVGNTPGSPHFGSNSNVHKYFKATSFKAFGGGWHVGAIHLKHWQSELHFEDCYVALANGTDSGGYAFHLTGDEANAVTNDLVIENVRVEGSSTPGTNRSNSRFIVVDSKGGIVGGRFYNNRWTIASDYAVELMPHRKIEQSDWILNSLWAATEAGFRIHGSDDAVTTATRTQFRLNTVRGPLGNTGCRFRTETGAEIAGVTTPAIARCTENVLISSTGHPFYTGSGISQAFADAAGNNTNIILANGAAAYVNAPVVRSRVLVSALTNGVTTFSAAGYSQINLTMASGTASIATITGGVPGQELTLVCGDASITFVHGTGTNALRLSGGTNITSAVGLVLRLKYDERINSNLGGWRQVAPTVTSV